MVTRIKDRLLASISQQESKSIQSALTDNQSVLPTVLKQKAQIKNAKLKTGLIAGF